MADFFAGTHLYGAIVTALFERERTGVARRVEVSMQDAVYASLSSSLGLAWGSQGGEEPPSRTANRHGGLAESPYNVYPTADGYIAIICVGEAHWRNLARLMDAEALASDPRFETLKARVANMDLVDTTVGEWTIQWPTEDLFDRLMGAHVPCAPVRTLEAVMADENMHARGALARIDHPEFGPLIVLQSPMVFEGIERVPLTPSKPLGADTADILSGLKDFNFDDLESATRAE